MAASQIRVEDPNAVIYGFQLVAIRPSGENAGTLTEHPELASVTLNVSPGCGFIQSGRVPSDDGSGYAEACGQLLSDTMMASLRELQPDVVVLMAARTDVKDREWDPAEGTLSNAD